MSANQKVENVLNLALDSSEEEREKSDVLNVGYEPEERTWDLIIKYSGSLDEVRQLAQRVVELQNEYAIITILQSRIEELARLVQVEYIEKPKRLFFQVEDAKRVSCMTQIQGAPFSLRGQGVLMAFLDSGIDYENVAFRYEDGTTKIRSLWDQSLAPRGEESPEGYGFGTEYSQQQINEALRMGSAQQRQMIRTIDTSGHGTAVAGIATAFAPEGGLLVVKLAQPETDGFPRTTELMMGLDYVIRKALEYQMPVSVNISFGNTYGSHDGTSLLERYIDDLSNVWKNCICIGTGNEGTTAGHTSGVLTDEREEQVEIAVQQSQPSFSVQLWKEYVDEVDISLISPAGKRVGPISEQLGSQQIAIDETVVLIYYGEPSPYSVAQEIFFDFIPVNNYVQEGIWRIVLMPRSVVDGRYELWLPSQSTLNIGTAFVYPTVNTTLTIPSTASRVISVGAYNPLTFTYADFSGRGYTRNEMIIKPDLVAPGVNIRTVAAGGGTVEVSGTSFATPCVTGAAALLMEWGIVRENDPFLYGEKVKAYLRRGAIPLPGFSQIPSPEIGFGRLCVRGSLQI